MSDALTREQIEEIRDWLILVDRNGDSYEGKLRSLCDMAEAYCRSLGTPSGEQEPVAWRYRYGATGMWKYTDKAEDCNPGPEYEREPLYGHPWEQPSGTVRVPVAWLIIRPHTVGKGEDRGVVLSPLTDEVHMDEGDEAWPLYLDEAAAPKDDKC